MPWITPWKGTFATDVGGIAARALHPICKHCNQLARAHYFAGDYNAAIALARQVRRSYPGSSRPVYRTLIAALGQTGQLTEAQTILSEGLELFGEDIRFAMLTKPPELSNENYAHMIDGYRKAGVLS